MWKFNLSFFLAMVLVTPALGSGPAERIDTVLTRMLGWNEHSGANYRKLRSLAREMEFDSFTTLSYCPSTLACTPIRLVSWIKNAKVYVRIIEISRPGKIRIRKKANKEVIRYMEDYWKKTMYTCEYTTNPTLLGADGPAAYMVTIINGKMSEVDPLHFEETECRLALRRWFMDLSRLIMEYRYPTPSNG